MMLLKEEREMQESVTIEKTELQKTIVQFIQETSTNLVSVMRVTQTLGEMNQQETKNIKIESMDLKDESLEALRKLFEKNEMGLESVETLKGIYNGISEEKLAAWKKKHEEADFSQVLAKVQEGNALILKEQLQKEGNEKILEDLGLVHEGKYASSLEESLKTIEEKMERHLGHLRELRAKESALRMEKGLEKIKEKLREVEQEVAEGRRQEEEFEMERKKAEEELKKLDGELDELKKRKEKHDEEMANFKRELEKGQNELKTKWSKEKKHDFYFEKWVLLLGSID